MVTAVGSYCTPDFFGRNSVFDIVYGSMQDHFDEIFSYVRDPDPIKVAAMHHALKEHMISAKFKNSRGQAPITNYSDSLVESTRTEYELRLQLFLDNARFVDGRQGRVIDSPNGFAIKDFYPHMPENWFRGMDKKPSSIQIGKWLRGLGYEKTVSWIDGKSITRFKHSSSVCDGLSGVTPFTPIQQEVSDEH